jgi:hypothetical protein
MDAPARTVCESRPKPLSMEPGVRDDHARWHKWAMVAIAVGLLARINRYCLRFPLWEDECFLCANLMDRSYSELTTELYYRQIAPAAFLMMQKAVVSVLGFHEFSLRLVPFLAGIASLFLFWRLAARVLSGIPYVLAVTLFAVSYPLIRYSAEAKPYGCDVLATLCLLVCLVEWLERPAHTRWLWRMAFLAPVAMAFSYSTTFVAGGISLAIALAWYARRQRGDGRPEEMPSLQAVAWPWLAFNVAVATAFLAVMVTSANKQADHSLEWMRVFWVDSFPPLAEPWRIPGWLTWVHTGELLAYPAGSHGGGSTLTFLACAAGVVWLVRNRRWEWCALACGPLALNLLAATLQRYPYGGQARLSLYHAPWFCVLAGLGCGVGLAWLNRMRPASHPESRLRVVVGLLLLVAVYIMGRDIAHPYKSRGDQRARDFARWFWVDGPSQCEAVCLRSDLKQEFHPDIRDELTWMTTYLCNQRIYSPRHAAGKSPAWDQVSAARPLWCLDFVPGRLNRDTLAEAAWLASMQDRYELIGELQFPFVRHNKHETLIMAEDYVKVWQFRPRAEVTAAREKPQAMH